MNFKTSLEFRKANLLLGFLVLGALSVMGNALQDSGKVFAKASFETQRVTGTEPGTNTSVAGSP